MRYEKGQKERTRQRVVDVASRAFRRDGIVASGIAGVMADAGLTQGGFYAHFRSKDDLVREAAVTALDQTCARLGRKADAAVAAGRSGFVAIVEEYLGPAHVAHPERGCAVAAAGAELARQPGDTRRAVSAAADRIVALIAAHLPQGLSEAEGVAGAVFGLAVGTLQLARLTDDEQEAARILAAGRRAALALAGLDEAGERPAAGRRRHGGGAARPGARRRPAARS